MKRQTQYAAYAGVYILVIIAVLGAVNFLADRYDKSYDSTSNKQFSLSDQTISQVRKLPRDVTINYFDETTKFPQARDVLDRYSSLSPKLHVNYIDPVKKPQQAQSAGFRRDLGLGAALVDSGTKKEEAKSLTEEELTGALIRSLKTGERNVCFLSAAGEHSVEETQARGYSYAKQVLERDNYKVRTIDLKPKAAEAAQPVVIGQAAPLGAVEVPSDCTVLVIAGPQGDYPQPIVDAIKSYVEKGGHALIMLDNTLPLGRQQASSDNAALVKVLDGWGVTVNQDLVLDFSPFGQLFQLGPEVPLVTNYESHTITQPLSRGVPCAFPLPRSLEIKSAASGSKLFGTGEDSVAVTSIPANGAVDPKKGKKGPLIMGAAMTLGGGSQGRVVVVGTSLWAQNNLIGSRQLGNRDLFGNMINWLSSDEDLISIRPKSSEDRPMNLSAQKLNSIFWLSVVIFPLAVVGFGMATWWKRR